MQNLPSLQLVGCALSLAPAVVAEHADAFQATMDVQSVENGYIVRRTVTNVTDKDENLYGLCLTLHGLTFGGKPCDDYYYTNENGRLFSTLTLPVDYDRTNENAAKNAELGVVADTRWADPGVIDNKIVNAPYQPFPALLISNYGVKNGLVCGTLSQDCFYHNYELSHEGQRLVVKINSVFKNIAYRSVKSGETLTDILYVGMSDKADDFNRLFDGYNAVLRRFLTNNCGSSETCRHSLIWDSWNDGIFRDVSEDMLLTEARAIKKLLPSVEWFQVDDGYSIFCSECDTAFSAHGLGVYYEENHGVDLKKFPNGLSGYTRKVKALGFKPAIWIGAACPTDTQIRKEKKEWFIEYSHRMDWAAPLDVSIHEVRNYMKDAFAWFVAEGFEGIKHDFWSYAYEDSHDLLSFKEKSGYEYREWWTKNMRDVLGYDGYIGTACDISMGNPFLGKYFNHYRFGIDIASGKWEEIRTTFFWGVCALSGHCGDLYIPNCDSVGFLPGLNDVDYTFVVNFAMISRSFVETSGKFSAVDENDKRLQMLQKASKYLNNGEDVYFAKFDYRAKGQNFPAFLYLKSHVDSPEQNESFRTLAVFNISEEEKELTCAVTDIELPDGNYKIKDFWSGEECIGNEIKVTLKAHGSRLFLIEKA